MYLEQTPFGPGEVFPEPIIATATLDRLLHHAHVVNIRGDSCRLKDKRRADYVSSPFGQKDRNPAQCDAGDSIFDRR